MFTGLISVEPQTLLFLDAVKAVASGQAKAQASALGSEVVGGRTCNRYTVAGSDGLKWEAWLEAKDLPLPCKLVSRDSDDPGAAVQTNEFTWAPVLRSSAETFNFTPPQASKQVDFGDLGFSELIAKWRQPSHRIKRDRDRVRVSLNVRVGQKRRF